MLTADLVRVRRSGSELSVVGLNANARARAVELAREYLAIAGNCEGAARAELEEAWDAVAFRASERKLALGLRKLIEDQLTFDAVAGEEPRTLRGDVFSSAAAQRKALPPGQSFDRDAIVRDVAERHGLTCEQLEAGLYGDLRAAQVLVQGPRESAERLVARYDLAQQQAVLLRAVEVIADVRCRDAYAYRGLFRKLKFLRLLHEIEPRADGGYRIRIDGPFSLFGPSTKYGLELALALPLLLACDDYVIRATLRWGKERTPLTFRIEGKAGQSLDDEVPLRLPDEVEAFRQRFGELDSPFEVAPSQDILEVRGHGLCVPDLRFIHRETGEVAYLEVLGYWSREAVWRRVELARAGLTSRVIFALSSRLRVSEEVLGEQVPSELYVYKGSLSAKEVLRRLSAEPA